MVLVIDVGNTNTVFGVYLEDGQLLNYWRKRTFQANTADELGMFVCQLLALEEIKKEDIKHVVVSSVVPNNMFSLNHMIQKYFNLKAFIVDASVNLPFKIGYDNPFELGADRISNVVGALKKYKPPFIIIDMGTATTFCCVDEKSNYIGGSICPGLKISQDALYRSAASLTRIEIEPVKDYIATNTKQSMKAGIYFGYIGLIEKIVKGMKKEMGDSVKVIATGGLSTVVQDDIDCFDYVDKLLTFEGIYTIFLLNKERINNGR